MLEPEELMARIVDLEEQLKVSEMAPPAAEQLIACLEGEIAKRDARIVELENDVSYYAARNEELRAKLAAPVSEAKAQGVALDHYDAGLLNDFGGGNVDWWQDYIRAELGRAHDFYQSQCSGLNAATIQQVSVPDDFVCDSKPLQELLNATAMLLEAPCQDSATYWAAQLANVEQLLAAPAAPAADAGIVDMYRHLQKVTPYRFKKIQDASITDGGDVLYFHKDRFDAALLDDMAAHCAAKGVV